MKEHIVKPDTYIPETGIEYPSKPDEHILNRKKIRDIVVDKDYPFFDKS